jgi:hypothetical protein
VSGSSHRHRTVARYRRPILPRSRQRPVAVVEGRATKNFNKNGVRLWTDPSAAFPRRSLRAEVFKIRTWSFSAQGAR